MVMPVVLGDLGREPLQLGFGLRLGEIVDVDFGEVGLGGFLGGHALQSVSLDCLQTTAADNKAGGRRC